MLYKKYISRNEIFWKVFIFFFPALFLSIFIFFAFFIAISQAHATVSCLPDPSLPKTYNGITYNDFFSYNSFDTSGTYDDLIRVYYNSLNNTSVLQVSSNGQVYVPAEQFYRIIGHNNVCTEEVGGHLGSGGRFWENEPANTNDSSNILSSRDIYDLAGTTVLFEKNVSGQDLGFWLNFPQLYKIVPSAVQYQGGEAVTAYGQNFAEDTTITMCGDEADIISQDELHINFMSTSTSMYNERCSLVLHSGGLDIEGSIDISNAVVATTSGAFNSLDFVEVPSIIDDPSGFMSALFENAGIFISYLFIPQSTLVGGVVDDFLYMTNTNVPIPDIYGVFSNAMQEENEVPLVVYNVTYLGHSGQVVFDPLHTWAIPPIVRVVTSATSIIGLYYFFFASRRLAKLFGGV